MGWLSTISSFFSALGGFFNLQSKKQDRLNAPDVIANRDAARDQKEKEKIQKTVEGSDKAGQVSEAERKQYAED